MIQLLFAIFIVSSSTMTTFAQTTSAPVTKDSATVDQKFYFPSRNYTDSFALIKAMPKLAEQVLSVYHDENRRTFFENSIYYYLLSENYNKAVELVDSVQKIDDDKSYDIDVKSYALAKRAEKKQQGSFEKVFKKEFAEAFGPLSFRKKVNAALVDSSYLDYYHKDYTSLKEKLQKNNKDSLDLEDARSLCDKFAYLTLYSKIFPLVTSLIDDQYKQTFPAIKSVKWAGVVPVQGIDEMPDPNMQYKLLFELTGFAYKGQDSTAKKEFNAGLGSVARELNLHEANGIPGKNIDAVVVVHAGALYSLLTNEKYKKKYGLDNPNIPLIKELQDYGVKIIVCGQAMTFLRLEKEDLVSGIKQALNAQTVISSYQLKNYVYFDMSLTE
jgi:intracellular sulfur oxidation DsrE/DsrF family protein